MLSSIGQYFIFVNIENIPLYKYTPQGDRTMFRAGSIFLIPGQNSFNDFYGTQDSESNSRF